MAERLLRLSIGGKSVKKRGAARNSGLPSIEDLIAAKKLADQLVGVLSLKPADGKQFVLRLKVEVRAQRQIGEVSH